MIHIFENEIPRSSSEDLLELVFEKAIKIDSSEAVGTCKDPDDEKSLTAAVCSHAEFLVTKNKKDFPSRLSSPKIVNVREFLKELESGKR